MKTLIAFIITLLIIACADKPRYYIEDNQASIGAPLLINHELEGYEDCLDCHTKGADDEATATTHPERTNCIQCHVPANFEIKPEYKNTFKTKYHLTEVEKKKLKESLKKADSEKKSDG